MRFKDFINETVNPAELKKFKAAFAEFAKAANMVEKTWADAPNNNKAFTHLFAETFKHSFDDCAYNIQSMNEIVQDM